MQKPINNQDKFIKLLLITEIREQYKILTDGGHSNQNFDSHTIEELESIRQTYWQQIEAKIKETIPNHFKYGINPINN